MAEWQDISTAPKDGTPNRPALRYHGGKWKLAPWIIGYFTPHRIYVEPFGGAASVLLRKGRSCAEVYNDLDGDVVNFFRVLQSDSALDLIEALEITPFSRSEFELAYEETDCSVERARRLVIRSLMGFGSDGCNGARNTGFRANSNRSGTTPAHDWAGYPASLSKVVKRFRGCIIENRPALDVMRQHDSDETLHYVDPPYLHETRSAKQPKQYRYEMDDNAHEELLEGLCDLEGDVLLSGYPNDLYDAVLVDWRKVERAALADGARTRTEVLWINPSAAAKIDADFFAGETSPPTQTVEA